MSFANTAPFDIVNYISQSNWLHEVAVSDAVEQPPHYNTGSIECITAIEASMSSIEFQGYCKANCLKYLWRYRYKNKPLEDLEKANWYLNRLIASTKEHEKNEN